MWSSDRTRTGRWPGTRWWRKAEALPTSPGTDVGAPTGVRLQPDRAPRTARALPPSQGSWAHARPFGTIAVALLALALSACGFHLRGEANFPFKTVFVNAPTSKPMATELERSISAGSDTRIAPDAAAAEVVLDVPLVIDDKDVLSLSSGGSVREYALAKRVQFRLHDKTGADWMQPGEIVIRRSYTFNETQVLARDLQEQRLLREMQTDAVQQILRRMQTAKRPG